LARPLRETAAPVRSRHDAQSDLIRRQDNGSPAFGECLAQSLDFVSDISPLVHEIIDPYRDAFDEMKPSSRKTCRWHHRIRGDLKGRPTIAALRHMLFDAKRISSSKISEVAI
jgi:hypothetical protein